jgi:hypothetical protein
MKYFSVGGIILSTLSWGYSIFSIEGVGEPILRRELFSNIYYSGFGFESELRWKGMKVEKVLGGVEFGIEHIGIKIPLGRNLCFNTGIEKVFNMNFAVKSEKKNWGEIEVEGKGKITIWENSFYKKIYPLEREINEGIGVIKVGRYKIIGKMMEEWKMMFDEGKDIIDTVTEEFSGTGYTIGGGVDFLGVVIYAEYYTPTKLNAQLLFPSRIDIKGEFNLTQKIRIGGEIFHYGWWGEKFEPMNKIEIGGKTEFKNWEIMVTKGWEKWYYSLYDYGKVRKNFITFSVGIKVKSRVKVELTTEISEKNVSSLAEEGVSLFLNFKSIELF